MLMACMLCQGDTIHCLCCLSFGSVPANAEPNEALLCIRCLQGIMQRWCSSKDKGIYIRGMTRTWLPNSSVDTLHKTGKSKALSTPTYDNMWPALQHDLSPHTSERPSTDCWCWSTGVWVFCCLVDFYTNKLLMKDKPGEGLVHKNTDWPDNTITVLTIRLWYISGQGQ